MTAVFRAQMTIAEGSDSWCFHALAFRGREWVRIEENPQVIRQRLLANSLDTWLHHVSTHAQCWFEQRRFWLQGVRLGSLTRLR